MSKVPYREHLRDVKHLAILHIILSLPFALESLEYIRHFSYTYSLKAFIGYIPTVLFILYLFISHRERKSTVLLTISYVASTLILGGYLLEVSFYPLNDIYGILRGTYESSLVYLFMQVLITALVAFVFAANIFFIIDSASRFKYRSISSILIIARTVAGIALAVLTAMFWYIPHIFDPILTNSELYDIRSFFISKLRLVHTMPQLPLIFAYFIFWRKCAEDTSAETLERKLYELKQSFESGAVTPKEYERRKAELIEKL